MRKHEIHTLAEYVANEKNRAKGRTRRRARRDLEGQIQREIIRWARGHMLASGDRIRIWHPANELDQGGTSEQRRRKLSQRSALGVLAGVPDLIMTNRAPSDPDARGIAFEVKAPGGKTSPAQDLMLQELQIDGWIVRVVYSPGDVLDHLQGLGFCFIPAGHKKGG